MNGGTIYHKVARPYWRPFDRKEPAGRNAIHQLAALTIGARIGVADA